MPWLILIAVLGVVAASRRVTATQKQKQNQRACIKRVVAAAVAAAQERAKKFTPGTPPKKAQNPSFQPMVDCLDEMLQSGLGFDNCADTLQLIIESEIDAGRVESVVLTLRNVGVSDADLQCLQEV